MKIFSFACSNFSTVAFYGQRKFCCNAARFSAKPCQRLKSQEGSLTLLMCAMVKTIGDMRPGSHVQILRDPSQTDRCSAAQGRASDRRHVERLLRAGHVDRARILDAQRSGHLAKECSASSFVSILGSDPFLPFFFGCPSDRLYQFVIAV